MNMSEVLPRLIENGLLSEDVEVISTHNNLVVASRNQKTVTRIGKISASITKENPNDVCYSHELSHRLGTEASVLPPVNRLPIIVDDLVLSSYPMINTVDWIKTDGSTLASTIGAFQDSYDRVKDVAGLAELDVYDYASTRLQRVESHNDYDERSLNIASIALSKLNELYPFRQLRNDDLSLVHGDLHSGNVLSDDRGKLRIIDLDSVANGPRLYDLASWSVRHYQGDEAPVISAVDVQRRQKKWNEEAYQALMSWKIISSMTHTLRHEEKDSAKKRISSLISLGRTTTRMSAIFGENNV